MANASIDAGYIGRSVPRVEDDRLLRGEGRFVDDLHVPGALEIAFLRSVHAHAKILSIELSAARAMPGVVAVYDGSAVAGRLAPLVNTEELQVPPGLRSLDPICKIQPTPPLALDEVSYVGQPVVMVVAESRYLAEDALETIEVVYEALPAVLDPHEALRADAPLVLLDQEDNIGTYVRHGVGDVESAFARAAVVIEETFESQRYVASPLETRGMVVQHDPFTQGLILWSTTQTPHRVRDHVAGAIGISVDAVRVVSVDVGGGFGQKGVLVTEEILVPFAAYDLGRSVRWIEDRHENLTADTHAREQVHHISLAADKDGRLLGVRDHQITNLGARNLVGLVVPYNALCHLTGAYRVPNVDIEATGVLTNTMLTAPYRGAGRPETCFAMERAMDRLAAELDLDPVELRERNLIKPEEMPYKTGMLDRRGLPQEFDSGDYPEMLDRAKKLIGLEAFRERQEVLRKQGRYVGVGFSIYLEMTGLGPFEGARLSVLPSGKVRLSTGAPSQGQGHRTVFAQIAADALGVKIEDIEVFAGDTSSIPYGVGTIASRALVTAGNAVNQAGELLQSRILALSGEILEIDPSDLILEDSVVSVRGNPETSMTLQELIRTIPKAAGGTGQDGLSETSYFQPPNYATASGLHATIVEVDAATGALEIEDYVVVHEAGRIVNPVIADAQIIGGTVQGIGGALFEHMMYDAQGQPVTSTYMDYLLPTVESIPDIKLDEVVCPSPTNALGVKGLGEGGAVGPPAALANAVEDALRPFDVVIRSCPLSPSRIRDLIRASQSAAEASER